MKKMEALNAERKKIQALREASQKSEAERKKTLEEVERMVKEFKDMESSFKDSELGDQCFALAKKINEIGFGFYSIDQVITFAERALKIAIDNNKPPLHISNICKWLGNACLNVAKLDEFFFYYDIAYTTLLEEANLDLLLYILQNVNFVTRVLPERKLDKVVWLKRMLEVKEKMMEKDCVELGKANMEVYEACLLAFDSQGALPYCAKALEVYKKHFGEESLEVAEVRVKLALLYYNLGEYEKAYELNQIAVGVIKRVAPNSADMVAAEADGASMMICLGKYKEAVVVLKRLATYTGIKKVERVKLLMSLAKSLCFLNKFADAKKQLRAVHRFFEKKEVGPKSVAIGFGELSALYEKMNEFETAISLLKRALAVPELPKMYLPGYGSKVFSLMSLSGKGKEGILFMKGFLKTLEVSFGPKNSHVGHGYAQLGDAYSTSGQKELAVKSLEKAKDILDVSLGPHDLNSLKTSHNLSVALVLLERYNRALEIEEKVAKDLKGLPPSELGFIHEVTRTLSIMKERVAESPTASSQSEDKGVISAKIAKCDISDDAEGT